MPLIEARGVSVRYGSRTVLTGIDLSLEKGEIVTVVGPNGSGKSSLMRLMIGALQPSAGTVARSPDLVIGYVPQKLAVDRTMPLSVDRFLSLSGRYDAATRAAMLDRVGLPGRGGAQISSLSGGEFQRAMLAQALLPKPTLLALDEATQGLDQPGVAAFYRLIDEVRTELGCGVMMISHDLHVVMSASDRVICLNGHICCEGAPTVVSGTPEYRALFGFGSGGALALYRHDHDHSHDNTHGHDHHHGHDAHGPARQEGELSH